eukprot:358433-Chlamydomonas_euryale.AAC.1
MRDLGAGLRLAAHAAQNLAARLPLPNPCAPARYPLAGPDCRLHRRPRRPPPPAEAAGWRERRAQAGEGLRVAGCEVRVAGCGLQAVGLVVGAPGKCERHAQAGEGLRVARCGLEVTTVALDLALPACSKQRFS